MLYRPFYPTHLPLTLHKSFQRNQLLCTSRMNRHTIIEIRLRRSHLDRNPKALQHLGAARPQDMQAHDLLLLARTDQLIARRALLLRIHHRVVHRGETRVVDLEILRAVLCFRVRLAQANAADFRVREHDGGDVLVVEMRVVEGGPAEETVGEFAAGGDGDGGEFDFAAHVAEGVDVVDVGVLVVVGDDVT